MTFSKFLRWLMALGIFAALIFWIHITYGWSKALAPWTRLEVPVIILSMGLMVLSYVFRALRIHDHFGFFKTWPVMRGISLVMIHNFMNNMMPMRTGEAAFPILMQRYFKVPLKQSIPSLIWFRVLDLVILIMIIAITFTVSLYSLWAGVLLSTSCLLAPWITYHVRRKADRWLTGRSGRVMGWFHRLVWAVPENAFLIWRCWGWTFACWIFKLAAFALLLSGFAKIPITTALLGSVSGEMSSVLPIHGFAGSGTYEAGVLSTLIPAGVPFDTAFQAALNLHLFILGVSLLTFIFSGLLNLIPSFTKERPQQK